MGMIRGGRANGVPCIPFTMDSGLVPGLDPFRALVSGPLTDRGGSDLARDWACDLTCDWSGDCLRKPDSDPGHVTGQVTFLRSRAGKDSCYGGRFVTDSTI